MVIPLVAFLALSRGAAAQAGPDPHFTFRPASGPIGTVVHYSGHETLANIRSYDGPPIRELSTVPPHSSCDFIEMTTSNHVHISHKTGAIHGSFTITPNGACQGLGNPRLAQPGIYSFAFGCTACVVGMFRVTSSGAGVLPFTGSPLAEIGFVGAALMVTGLACMTAARRCRGLGYLGRRGLRGPTGLGGSDGA